MKRRAIPFSVGLVLSLLVLVSGIFYVGRVWALSNVGPDATDFAVGGTNGAYYTLSKTADVANTTAMGLNLYHSGAKPGAAVTVTVAYQAGAGTCLNQNDQGFGGVHFSYGVGAVSRQLTLSIPTTAWVSNGVGYSVDLTATLVNGPNSCNGGNDGDHVNFRMTAPAGYLIGPDATQNFAVAQGSYCVSNGKSCNAYDEYDIPFAPPCSLNTNGSAAAKLIDMDNDGTHPVIQPNPASVKIVDTTTNTTVNNNSYTGSESNGSTATFTFPYIAHHHYMLKIININLNNVLQMQIPFDSVNSQINCGPSGGITSSASAACTSLQGWMYDVDNSATALQYYVLIGPASAPPATYASYPGGSNFIGPFTANLTNPAGTPAGTPINHGFKLNIPADVAGHGYDGPWNSDTYYVYAKDATATTLNQVSAPLFVPAGTCASVSCGDSNFDMNSVGTTDYFAVDMLVSGATTVPPGNPTFTITVTGNGAGTNSQTYNNVAVNDLSPGHVLYSVQVPFTPAAAGNYSVSWSFYGKSGCSDDSTASYTPFFTVEGGDIAAGAGFGNGSCTDPPADILSWNKNAADYFGGGSRLGALATGNIEDFASGLGLSAGGTAQAGHGLSFANVGNGKANTPSNYGGGFGANSITCVADYYGGATGTVRTSGLFGAGDVPAGAGTYNFNINAAKTAGFGLTLGTGSDMFIHASETVTLYVYGNVYIANNIKYDGYGLATVPRFNLYVSGNIYINPNVTELHGVYMAQKSSSLPGDITTCADSIAAAPVAYATCSKRLLVVGAMSAEGNLRLTRTHGHLVAAPGVPAEPAETFQYGPELWLSAPPLTQLKPKAYTSLPPVL